MPDNSLLKKMRLQPGQQILLLNGSPEWQTFFAQNHTVSILPESTADLILFFAPDKATLDKLVPVVKNVVTPEGVVWVAYPKGSSKMQTDLTRDKGWESVSAEEWQFLNLISLDDKWSAFSFRKAGDKPTKVRRALRDMSVETVIKPENPYIDTVNRVVNLPEDLAQALAENKEAFVFFEKLSFTNRKEYVHWVTSAKREETREKRVLETIAKLDKGLKNPMDKGK
ncbi:YdeI/OmpD-associated family protein [Adhaeribacter sp. BT258]|uniref:YdeI/OmpD-associated family protein n=1 Tax=Adhaeribacter terrigena TaxID=2793070 RepID=A0ABS1BY20_9BACT|nr:YdeI/OmpD-associated family protein [Adhaeribacter terrigena]MBK0401933.1 YdeI/OmpD-associated family protein [Adhaeribacter terrigena]